MTFAAATLGASSDNDGRAGGGADTAPEPVCHSYQWVGTAGAGACPAVAGWDLEVFATSTTSDYCVYTWNGPAEPMPAEVQGVADAGVQDLTEDCPVVYPQQSYTPNSYDTQIAGVLRSNLRMRARGGTLPTLPPAGARVVVIDTAPDSGQAAIPIGNDRHGDTLAHTIKDIACQGSSCAVEVKTALALPWVSSSTRDLVNGGHIGTRTDLAKAIVRATNQWLSDLSESPQDTPPNLILNLSLGWEEDGPPDPCNPSTGIRNLPSCAVYEALHDAASVGALIIAAAGNHTWGATPPSGLLLPGRWQDLVGPGQYGLLLAAAHGVDYSNQSLATVRPHGTSAFAGVAMGTAARQQGASLPPALTGSSVAAAVLSAVSAVVWAFAPSLGAADVLDIVHNGAVPVPLNPTADSCPPTLMNCDVRRVSVCGALSQLPNPISCSAAATPPAIPRPPPIWVSTQTINNTGWQSVNMVPPPNAQAPAPQAGPGVFPQPLFPSCPSCWVYRSTLTTNAYVTLSVPLNNPTLVVNSTNNGPLAIPLPSTSGAVNLTLPSLFQVGSITSAYVTGDDPANPGYSATYPVHVL